MDKQGLEDLVSVQAAGLRGDPIGDSLGVFDGHYFHLLVGSGMVG